MQETFYATFAQLSLALLGLWWVVVQFKYQQWMTDPARRRMAYNVSLYFTLPGVMSLVSLLSADATFLWRSAFALAGGFGLVEAARLTVTAGGGGHRTLVTVGRWLTAVLYALVVLVALVPGVVGRVGIALTPIEVEGLMLAVILFIGINFTWWMFTEAET